MIYYKSEREEEGAQAQATTKLSLEVKFWDMFVSDM
jgi:hypothetical protein